MDKRKCDMGILNAAVGRNSSELYGEYQIVNKTDRDIGVVNRFGERFVLPAPEYEVTDPYVLINVRRSCNINRSTGGSRQTSIPSTEIIVPVFDFIGTPVHVAEVDLVVCSAEILDRTTHPAGGLNYTKALKNNLDEMVGDDLPTTLRIFANDPTGKLKSIEWQFMDKEITVPVMASDTSEAEIIFVVSSDGKAVLTKHISLEELPDDGCIEWANGFVLHIAENSGRLKCGLDKKVEISNRPEYNYDDLIKQNTQKVTQDLTHKHNNEKTKLEEQIRKLKRALDDEADKRADAERECLEHKHLLGNYKAIMDSEGEDAKRQHERATMSVKEEELKTKLKESEAKQQRAERSAEAERWKSTISVASTVITTLATITVLLMKHSK